MQDEFNRLEEKMLSAVSQQIQAIQLGLKARAANDASEIDLADRRIKVNLDTGIFISKCFVACRYSLADDGDPQQ